MVPQGGSYINTTIMINTVDSTFDKLLKNSKWYTVWLIQRNYEKANLVNVKSLLTWSRN